MDAKTRIGRWPATPTRAFGHLALRFGGRVIVPVDANFRKSPFHRRDYSLDPDPPNQKVC